MKPPPAILFFSTDPTGDYLAPTTAEITGDTADALGVAGIEVACYMPYPTFAEMEVWDDGADHSLTGDAPAPPPPAPVGYRVTRAWYEDDGDDMGQGELAAWIDAWKRDLAGIIHEHLMDRACSAAEQRAEMAGGL